VGLAKFVLADLYNEIAHPCFITPVVVAGPDFPNRVRVKLNIFLGSVCVLRLQGKNA